MSRRVVITSVGVVSPLGFIPERILRNLQKKNVSFARPAFDRETPVCPIRDFNVKDFTGRFKNLRYLNRGAQFCAAAAIMALKNAGLAGTKVAEAGLFVGIGPNLDIGGECPEVRSGAMDSKALKALWILRFLPNTAASAIAGLAGIHGENATLNTACAASLQAIGEAFRKIKDGYLDMALPAGGIHDSAMGEFWPTKKRRPFLRARVILQRNTVLLTSTAKDLFPGRGALFSCWRNGRMPRPGVPKSMVKFAVLAIRLTDIT